MCIHRLINFFLLSPHLLRETYIKVFATPSFHNNTCYLTITKVVVTASWLIKISKFSINIVAINDAQIPRGMIMRQMDAGEEVGAITCMRISMSCASIFLHVNMLKLLMRENIIYRENISFLGL